ncbi:ntf2-like protein [Diplodia corticola]|uniref:Ntf2-like protein n=1 Tax=Diplodia corticola TaxID=236234 RepID=A0A1J9QSD5_9PEZI|nr:ntf2-like protein [Diplodia corticola]OJD30898.1 ntf2-like protein [Diplodia corticola]
MALSAAYQSFLGAPATAQLAPGASLHYVPTTTTVTEPTAILKHLVAQGKLLKKKAEKILSTIESSNGLCLDVETTLELVNGGGAYLPGLDDNFIADRTVTFPVIHIVQFDAEHKIVSIRMHWDQASLLKQVDVIGARARNWPIRDAKDQIRLINVCAASAPAASSAPSRRNTSAGDSENGSRPQTSRSNTSATTDPHASLSLFAPREEEDEPETPSGPRVERARASKPVSRGLHEIISPEHQAPERSASPAKAGAAKHYHPIRIFENEGETQEEEPAHRGIKSNAKKYNHFEFGEGEDAPQAEQRPASKSKKHTPQWGFEDFATPEKTRTKILPQHTKSIGWSDDEEPEESPVKRPVVHQPRKDARTHFDFDDEATPVAQRTKEVSGKGNKHSKGLGLYQDPILDEEEEMGKNGPLRETSKNTNSNKHIGSSFEISDDSPNPSHVAKPNNENTNGGGMKKLYQDLDANWESTDKPARKERGINIGGDGMGGKKGSNRDWMFGEDDAEEDKGRSTITGRKITTMRDPNKTSGGSFWDF